MTGATGVGSLPGTDLRTAVRVVLDVLPGLPFLPELPARGVHAGMVGRTLAAGLPLDADLQPAGWRLTGSQGATGLDQRRARSLLAHDLDVLEEEAAGYSGPLKVQLTGPLTLAATVERPRGDAVLGDHGARRELAQALAEAVAGHVTEVRRRVPGAEVWLQLDEPALPSVLAGRVPTASGLHRHRSVDLPEASATLAGVLGAAGQAGALPLVHSCASDVPLDLLVGAGARGVSVDAAQLTATGFDAVAGLLESGTTVLLGVAPADAAGEQAGDRAIAARVRRLLDLVGVDPAEVPGALVLTPACGLASADERDARDLLAALRRVAADLG